MSILSVSVNRVFFYDFSFSRVVSSLTTLMKALMVLNDIFSKYYFQDV